MLKTIITIFIGLILLINITIIISSWSYIISTDSTVKRLESKSVYGVIADLCPSGGFSLDEYGNLECK